MNSATIQANQTFANLAYKNNFSNENKNVNTHINSNIENKTNINKDINQRKVLASKSEDGYFYIGAEDISEAAKAVTMTVAPELLINTLTYQPNLTDNPAEEAALFREMLRPFADLPEKPRQKAILKLIKDRLAEKITYAEDIDTEGVEEYSSSVAEILADNGKGIDCEDYAQLANFYFNIAQEENLLPEDAKMVNLSIPEHQFAVYISPSYEGGIEYYVIDTLTVSYRENIYGMWPKNTYMLNLGEKLDTLKEYSDIAKENNLQPIEEVYTKTSWFRVSKKVSPFDKGGDIFGLEIVDKNFVTDFSKNNNSIDKNISSLDITKIQHKYLVKHGKPKIPDNYNQSAFEDYTNAIKIKNTIGWQKKINNPKTTITAKDFNITSGQASYLIGTESKMLNKKLTIADLSLTEQQKIKLLGSYSPILKRNFTHADLNLDADIEIPSNKNNMSLAVTPLLQTENNNSENILDTLEFKYNLRLQELVTPASLAIDLLSALCEVVISDIIANRKYHKVKKRDEIFVDPKKILEQLLTCNNYNNMLSSVGLNNIKKILILQPSVEKKTKLINIKYLLELDGKNVSLQDIKNICININKLLQSSINLPKEKKNKIEKLKNLYNALDVITEDIFSDINLTKTAVNIFKPLGIILKYKTNKLLGKYIKHTNIQAINHKLIINIDKFYKFLKKYDLLPELSYLACFLKENMVNLCILHKMSKLDQRKIRYHKIDKKLKKISVAGALVPIIPVSDITKAYMYNRGKTYRKKNQQIINTRIDKALTLTSFSTLTCDEKNSITNKLTAIKTIKTDHLQIKIKQNQANSYIHSVSAAMFFTSILFGPIGSAVKVGIKSSSKLSASVAGSVKRYQVDTKHKKADSFITTKDIYLYFKKLYLAAKQQKNIAKMEAIADLINICFQIEPEAFDLLVATEIIENDIYKISLSHKIT